MNENNSELSLLRHQAIQFLSRRDYSRQELYQKLVNQTNQEVLNQVLEQLVQKGLLKEERFVESFVRSRISKGYGPVRIIAELQQRGIATELISSQLDLNDPLWVDQAKQAFNKKFKTPAKTPNERAKQMRFLQYRGFTHDQIRKAFSK